jgi:hypothetical protein
MRFLLISQPLVKMHISKTFIRACQLFKNLKDLLKNYDILPLPRPLQANGTNPPPHRWSGIIFCSIQRLKTSACPNRRVATPP